MRTTRPTKILCAAVLAFSVLTACKLIAGSSKTAKDPDGSSATNSAAGFKETAANADAKTALVSSMKNFQNVKTWIAEVDAFNDAVPSDDAKGQIKYVAPDRFQLESQSANRTMHIIAIGGKFYEQADGKWQEASDSFIAEHFINNFKGMFSDQELATFKNIESAGEATVDGKDLAVYTYEIDRKKEMSEETKKKLSDEAKAKIAELQSENKAKIWIDEGANLPAKMEMTMKMSDPQKTTLKFALRYIYDQEVKIEAPELD